MGKEKEASRASVHLSRLAAARGNAVLRATPAWPLPEPRTCCTPTRRFLEPHRSLQVPRSHTSPIWTLAGLHTQKPTSRFLCPPLPRSRWPHTPPNLPLPWDAPGRGPTEIDSAEPKSLLNSDPGRDSFYPRGQAIGVESVKPVLPHKERPLELPFGGGAGKTLKARRRPTPPLRWRVQEDRSSLSGVAVN